MQILSYIYILLIIFFSNSSYALDTKAEQAIIVDFKTNEILFEKNADYKIPPASITKIMTVYLVFDRIKNTNLNFNDLCLISPTAYKMGGSRTFLEINDQVTVEDLIKGVIIQSGNDASVAIAECLSGTESDFASLMNIYAEKLKLKNTNFINSSGWPNENHFSTVRDLAILSNSLIRDFPKLYQYFKMKEFTYNEINQPNRNRLLSTFIGADGLKTGFTKKSGWGISASAIRNGRRITVVINGTNSSNTRINEASNLLNWAFTQTSLKKILSKNQIIKNVDVWLGKKPTINLTIESDVVSIVSFDQIQSMKSLITFDRPINAPIVKGDKLGVLEISIKGKENIVIPLVAEINIKKINPIYKIFAALKYLIFGTSLDEI